jgi:hypothetical protein
LRHQHFRLNEHAERVQVGTLLCVVDTGRTASGASVGVVGQRVDHLDDRPILQERQLARAEVIEQRTERLGPHGHLRVKPPAEVRVERRDLSG